MTASILLLQLRERSENLTLVCGERSRMLVGFVGEYRKVTNYDGVAMWNERIEATNGQRSVYNTAM